MTQGDLRSAGGGAADALLADGGCISNPALHPLLQRRARRIALFLNFQTPLASREAWDPTLRPPTGSDCSEELPALFGCILDTSAWSFQRNAVFPAEDLARVACALQDAAADGRGAVATLEHVTISNAWWGIPAGHKVTITWCYLSAAPAWVARLPADVAARLRPNGGDPLLGPAFPHFGTLDLSLQPRQVNLLNSLVAWTMMEHRQLFQDLLEWKDEQAPADELAGRREKDGGRLRRGARVGGASAVPRLAAGAGRVAAQAIASALLGARHGNGDGNGAKPSAAEPQAPSETPSEDAVGRKMGDSDGSDAQSRTLRARRAIVDAFKRVRGLLPSG
jgi:hypothetical protein